MRRLLPSIAVASFMRLPASLRAWLYGVGAMVAASGIAWLLSGYGSRSLAVLSMEVHGAATTVLLILIGSTVALHAPAGWRERKNRTSGLVVAAVLTVLTITGYLLYYLGDEHGRLIASITHWSLGLAAPLLLFLHAALGRRSRSA